VIKAEIRVFFAVSYWLFNTLSWRPSAPTGGLNPFTSAIVQSVIELGLQETQLAYPKEINSRRKSILCTALRAHLPSTVSFTEPDGGFFIWLRLPPHVDTEKLFPQARRHNVGFSPGARFSPCQELKTHMRLSFAYYEESDLAEAARRLGEVIRWGLTSDACKVTNEK
jgi:DNA-binding transcriptional MocR family regulator